MIANYKVFDIEAYNWNKVYAIGIYNGKETKMLVNNYYTNNAFIEWLLNNLQNGDIIYAHNGGRYDFLFIFDYLRENKKAKLQNIKVISSSVVMFKINYKGKTLEFRDSFSILPASLKRLTNDFDVLHKKLEMDYDIGTEDVRFQDYFRNDLIGLYEVLEKAGELREKLTIASNSMHIFLRDYYKKKPYNNSLETDNTFRAGYYGGRVEVFKMQGESLHYYDVNSLYPSVMVEQEYPVLEKNNWEYTTKYIKNELGYYYCHIEAPKMEIPLLPYHRIDGKLLFPYGKWAGWYYSPEIDKAKEIGYNIKVDKGYVFPKTDFLFKDFVEHYYEIKKNSSGSKKAIAKMVLNSLYGKFAQRHIYDTYVIGNEESRYSYIPFLNLQRKKTETFSRYQHTEIAGFITSYARLKLYNLFEKAGLDRVYYCDTDSLFTDSLMHTSNELGDIKNEADVKEFIAIAPKVYAYIKDTGEVVIKAKGLNSSKLSFEDFKNAHYNNDYSKFNNKYTHPASFKAYNIRHLKNFTDTLEITRQLRGIYDKRIILQNGVDTEPYKIEG